MPPDLASGTFDTYEPIVIAAPSSFTECVPTNITWTGGIAPYSLRVTLADSSFVLQGFDGINVTNFVWTPDVPAGTNVSLELGDARPVDDFVFTQDPIGVGAGPDGASCRPPATSIQQITSTLIAITASSIPNTTQSQIPTSLPSMQVVPRNNPVSGVTIAATVVGVVIFLLLAAFPCWRSRVAARRRLGENTHDTEKQEVVDGGNDLVTLGERQRSDTEPTQVHSIPGPSDRPASSASNPFEDPENALHTEEIFAASPVSDPDDVTPTPSFFIGALPSSPRPANMTVPVQPTPLRPKVVQPRLRRYSVSAQSDSDTRTLSDTDAARLSMTTSSTLPPSYRTRRSAGSIYIPPPGHPPFPPPVYTPQRTGAPPSAFRPPRRTPPRRRPAPTPPKMLDSRSARSPSGERELSGADGMRRESTRETNRVEGLGAVEEDVDAASDLFSDGRSPGSLDGPLVGTGPDTDTIPERLYVDGVGVVNVGGTGGEIPAADWERT